MINLSNLVFNIKDINPIWTFSHYLKIPVDQFNGSDIKIKSIFKPDERTPSFCIYSKDNVVKFKDFSTGKGGSHVDLVSEMEQISSGQACSRIINAHNKWVMEGGVMEECESFSNVKYKISGFKKRVWNVLDRDYWLSYSIGSSRLEWGLVTPLAEYNMQKEEEVITIIGDYIYGYFNRAGELVKIYQPKNANCKFFTVKEYIAGDEHEESNDYLLIQSSWKDALCVKDFNLKIDIKVPNSENSRLPQEFLERQKKKYAGIITLFDADDAGIKAMIRYKELYGFDYIFLDIEKDVSDSIQKKGQQFVKNRLIPLIHKKLNQ
jgi:hypothetical protein